MSVFNIKFIILKHKTVDESSKQQYSPLCKYIKSTPIVYCEKLNIK